MESPVEGLMEPQDEVNPESTEERLQNEELENDVVIAKAHSLIERITGNADNPNPKVLHALSTLLETQEARYLEDAADSSSSSGRSSHIVGQLGNLIRDNDEFFMLISSKFLTETTYSASVRAASVRLLVSCSPTWMYPHIFDDDVLANIRGWVMEGITLSSNDEHNINVNTNEQKTEDSEMLLTYSIGLLAVCLECFDQLVEDVLTSGLSAKLMRYLRLRILGGNSTHQEEGSQLIRKIHANVACQRTRDEAKVRLRSGSETSPSDAGTSRLHLHKDHGRDPFQLDNAVGDNERCLSMQPRANEEGPDGEVHKVDSYDHFGENEESDENLMGGSLRRRSVRGISRSHGKSKPNEFLLESELPLAPPCGTAGLVQTAEVKNATNKLDLKGDSKCNDWNASKIECSIPGRHENDDCFQGCKVGSKDISDLVKKAVQAAEAEAREANASAEAIKVAGDDAAEMVKSVALEEYAKSYDEEAAVAAASRAATSVIDAAGAVYISRNSTNTECDSGNLKPAEPAFEEDTEFYIPDSYTLGKLREKFCIQCLGSVGGYVEGLGPVLHEMGVDVCLSLLVNNSKDQVKLNSVTLLPDILKLISALATHRNFAASFVDGGGIQRLLNVPRTSETFSGLSSCLQAVGSSQGIMERVCALSSNVVYQFVRLALQLLECEDPAARKNASLFFFAVFVFRPVIDAFDKQNGLLKLLSLLHEAALVRSGVARGPSDNRASLRSDRSPAVVLTSSEKQIAYHTCLALSRYFQAHLLLLIDTIRPSKNVRHAPRNMPNVSCKPLDISDEAMSALFRQIHKDRKLGPALVRTPWDVVDRFLASSGHITMLELCQAPPVEGYLHGLLEYALGVLHIVTLSFYSRKPIVNATLSNGRIGIAVILDLANVAGCVEPEVVVPALNVLINLVCPPPSISNKPSNILQSQHAAASQSGNVPILESRDKIIERNVSGQPVNNHSQGDPTEPSTLTVPSGLVGDGRISLGARARFAGLSAQIEQGYRQARDAVRANDGIGVLLRLIQPQMVKSPAALDCLRALTCRVLLGLARDDTIARMLDILQVREKLSELIRDSGNQTSSGEQNRWQSELAQVAVELIGVITNSGRASTLVANDAATPTLRRIERDAITAATPITYDSKELLLLIHEHLQAVGCPHSAAVLLKESNLTPLPSQSSSVHPCSKPENSALQVPLPSGRAASGFLVDKPKPKGSCDSLLVSSRKKHLPASAVSGHLKLQLRLEDSPVLSKFSRNAISQDAPVATDAKWPVSVSPIKPGVDEGVQFKTPMSLPKKRKAEMRDGGPLPSAKKPATGEHLMKSISPNSVCKSSLQMDAKPLAPSPLVKDQVNRPLSNTLVSNLDGSQLVSNTSQQASTYDQQHCGSERQTLESIVVQCLKHQHRQCPSPITTLPPFSLLHPHVCPESRRGFDAPSNVTSRLSMREFRSMYGCLHGQRKDRHFVYSRFRPWRTSRDDGATFLTCITFLGDSSKIAVAGESGELKVFESNTNNLLDSYTSHQSPVTLLQSHFSGEVELLLSSSEAEVRLWDALSVSGGPKHTFDGIKAARFNNSGSMFAALRHDIHSGEILLYDVHTCQLDVTLKDTSSTYCPHSLIHFSQDSSSVLWNGVLWDYRQPKPVYRFDKFDSYGGGGFHPTRNQVIIDKDVWDLRKFGLLQTVPSLSNTEITFNSTGDVIYAIQRRVEDMHSAFRSRRQKHPLYSAFRTVDAVNYSDIATISADRCVLDLAAEPTDSFVGLITVDDEPDGMCSFVRVYEIGRRKPTDDDSDPDDAESEEEEEDDEGDDDSVLDVDIDENGDSDADEDGGASDFDDEEEDGDFLMNDIGFDGGGILEILAQGVEEDDSDAVESSSGDEDEDEDHL